MKAFAEFAIGVVLMRATQPAWAATFVCAADPKAYLAVGGGGLAWTVVDNGSQMVVTAVCSMTSNDGPVTPQACTSWYAMMLAARSSGAKLLPHLNSADASNAGATGCASF